MNQPPRTKLYLEARYRKLSRDLPQTVFFCPECKGHPRRRKKCERCEGFGKLTRDSVQELVAWVVAKGFGTRKTKFHGAGREDVDVRMLGDGRPFVLELLDPKVFDADLAELEAEVNRRNEGRLELVGLCHSEKKRVVELKETHHAKEYEAAVSIDGDIGPDAMDEFIGKRIEITQRTPSRVAHRRADLERKRWIEPLEFGPHDEHPGLWRLRLRTQHGTYVKEVLSGEEERTTPSLASLLGMPCKCEALDVLAILGNEGESIKRREMPAFGAGLE